MRPLKLLVVLTLCHIPATSQNAAFPLESVLIEGSTIPQAVILEMTGLRISSPIDKSGIEQACGKLQVSGLFASISYRYAPGPNKGYAVTLVLADQDPLTDAAIDVPGADEKEAWQWLAARFRRFEHRVPQPEAAQKYLAGELEQHLGSRLRGQHLAVRMESDLETRKLILSFQPEVLPQIQSVTFSGNQAVASGELGSVMNRIAANTGYTERRLAALLELNLRPVYEQRGFYRVQFSAEEPKFADSGVSVNVRVGEGSSYRLGKVEFAGENLPVASMQSAAKLPTGKVADWKQIQEGIWEMERVVKRTGYFAATVSPDRSYDDAAHILNLRIRVNRGPLYHYGEVRFTGLAPELEKEARRLWKPKAGDAYDYRYPDDFFQAFSQVVDFHNLRKHEAVVKAGAGDHVMDISLVFEAR
jgi:outer membrane protein insertion porin family